MRKRLTSALLGTIMFTVSFAISQAEEITAFAAASLTNALQEISAAYVAQGGSPLQFSFASSSTLARQIEAGAPAAIFASADQKWMDYLAGKDLIITESRVSPIGNDLVLIAPLADERGDLEISNALDWEKLLGEHGRLSVGDPDHVPAGLYAKEALENLGLWESVEARLARGDNVRAALALVERGEVPLGIVYATDAAQSNAVKVIGRFPADSFEPITYPFALLKGHDTPEAKKAFAFLTGAEAGEIYKKFGFSLK